MLSLRKLKNQASSWWMWTTLLIILALPIAIVAGLVAKSLPILHQEALVNLLFSEEWQPMKGEFGFSPFILSSAAVSVLGLLIMIPLGIFPAIYLTQFAPNWLLKVLRSVIDILAGIPSVIHGVWGVLVVVPFIGGYLGPLFGVNTAGYTILAGSIVLAVSVIPFVLHMLLEVFRGIPVELQEASLSLGATKWETIKKALIRKAMPGIIAAYSLGMSKAFGETIAVLMVVGNVTQTPKGIFQAGYPLPALIANNYGEMLSIPMYDSALMFAALLLFIIVLIFNVISRFFILKTATP